MYLWGFGPWEDEEGLGRVRMGRRGGPCTLELEGEGREV